MRQASVTAVVVLLAALAVCVDPAPSGPTPAEAGPAPRDFLLGDIPNRHNADWYIEAAAHLQGKGRRAACDQLRALARQEPQDLRVFVLCRMLFQKACGGEFRRPLLGYPCCLGETEYEDWPLEPIELVDGVPFVITSGYVLGGEPESALDYVNYCIRRCDWSAAGFEAKTAEQKQGALEKLIASPRWRRSLRAGERNFLADQLR